MNLNLFTMEKAIKVHQSPSQLKPLAQSSVRNVFRSPSVNGTRGSMLSGRHVSFSLPLQNPAPISEASHIEIFDDDAVAVVGKDHQVVSDNSGGSVAVHSEVSNSENHFRWPKIRDPENAQVVITDFAIHQRQMVDNAKTRTIDSAFAKAAACALHRHNADYVRSIIDNILTSCFDVVDSQKSNAVDPELSNVLSNAVVYAFSKRDSFVKAQIETLVDSAIERSQNHNLFKSVIIDTIHSAVRIKHERDVRSVIDNVIEHVIHQSRDEHIVCATSIVQGITLAAVENVRQADWAFARATIDQLIHEIFRKKSRDDIVAVSMDMIVTKSIRDVNRRHLQDVRSVISKIVFLSLSNYKFAMCKAIVQKMVQDCFRIHDYDVNSYCSSKIKDIKSFAVDKSEVHNVINSIADRCVIAADVDSIIKDVIARSIQCCSDLKKTEKIPLSVPCDEQTCSERWCHRWRIRQSLSTIRTWSWSLQCFVMTLGILGQLFLLLLLWKLDVMCSGLLS